MNSNKKIKILFIVSEFWQAGTQRFTFEVDRAIDKKRFIVNILSLRDLNSTPQRNDYYYEKHLELGSEIFFLNDLLKEPKKYFLKKIMSRFQKAHVLTKKELLSPFFDNYNVISILGEYNFHLIFQYFTNKEKKKTIIHIMNSLAQNKELYNGYDKLKHYNFSSGFTKQEIKLELKEFDNYNHYYYPLSILIDKKPILKEKKKKCKKIGVFTRLTNHKPLDQFFYSFHLLLDVLPEVELNIYGSGDPEKEGMLKYVKKLNIQDKVFFKGHQKDMKKTALSDDIDLVWFHGYYGVPGGFAGFDICTLAIPQIFWDFTSKTTVKNDFTFPMYNHLQSFVNKTYSLLSSKKKSNELAEKQYDNIYTKRNIFNEIKHLEKMYEGFKK